MEEKKQETSGKPVGRPPGSIDPVLTGREFGLDQFVAVKTFLYGIDPLTAIKRYILREDAPTTSESAMRLLAKTMDAIAKRGLARKYGPDSDLSPSSDSAARALEKVALECFEGLRDISNQRSKQRKSKETELIRRAEAANLKWAPKRKLPTPPTHFATLRSFDDWYEDKYMPEELLDPIELKAQYEEHLSQWYADQGFYYEPDYSSIHHQHSESLLKKQPDDLIEVSIKYCTPESRSAAARLIDQLQWTVQRIPNAADHVDAWIGGTTLLALKNADVFTLFTLVDLIKKHGRNWWRQVPRLGPVRAARITNWLQALQVQGVAIQHHHLESIQKRRQEEILQAQRQSSAPPYLAKFELEPLAPFIDRDDLNGKHGVFKSKEPNLFRAETDIDAIVVALEKYLDKPATLAVYAREILRFCLWSYTELKQPISSIGVHEARLYRVFLADIPEHWISTSPSPPPRFSSEWRPFRGQLDPASQRKALTSINVVFGMLLNAGYLTGNPMAGVLKHSELGRPKLDVSRSLSIEQWTFANTLLDQDITLAAGNPHPKSQAKLPMLRRLKALLHVLFGTGLRRDELFKARLGHLTKITVDGKKSYLLQVIGKRSKERRVPIEQDLMQLILNHVADRDPAFGDDLNDPKSRLNIPLISVLKGTVKTFEIAAADNLPGHKTIRLQKRKNASEDGALSPDGMFSQLRSFFARCAEAATEHGIDREAFDNATLHWLRHTFGHSMFDAKVDARVTQAVMGHVNANTTAYYAKADIEQMVRGMRQGADAIQVTSNILGYSSLKLSNPEN